MVVAILQVGLVAVLVSFLEMPLVYVAFRELTVEKPLSNPCLNHVNNMPSPSELACHNHHLNTSGLCSFNDSEIFHPVLQVGMEHRPKAVNMGSLELLDVVPVGCPNITSTEER